MKSGTGLVEAVCLPQEGQGQVQVLRRGKGASPLAAQIRLGGEQGLPHRRGELDGQEEPHEFFLLFKGF